MKKSSAFVIGLSLLFCFFVLESASTTMQPTDKVFFGNLHSHTSFSDGLGKPREAYLFARNTAKLDFLALTEHNHAEALGSDNIGIGKDAKLYKGPGAEALIPVANALTQNGRFVALYGQEFSTISSGNHVNVFDIGEVINVEKGRFDKLLQFLAVNKDSTGRPAVVMLNHPNNAVEVLAKEYGRDDFASLSEFVARMGAQSRLIQIINGPGQNTGTNLPLPTPAEQAYFKFLSLGFKVAPTADQDNHTKNWGTATTARTAVIAPALTKADLLTALRQRHVYATEDKNLSIVIKVNGHLCGDVIAPLPPPGELTIQYSIFDPDEPQAEYGVRVFRGAVGGNVATLVNAAEIPAGNGSGVIEDVAFSGEAQYFFFIIVQFNENGREDRVWTAPVWFQSQPEGSTPAPVGAPIEPALTANFVASKKSSTFHVSNECLDARQIKPANLVTGTDASQGRQQHQDCPRRN